MDARNTERQGARFGLPESFASTVPDSLEDSPGPASPKRKFKEAEATSGFSFLSRDQEAGSAVPSHQNVSPAKGTPVSPFGKKPTYGGAAAFLGNVAQPSLSPGNRTANRRSSSSGKGSPKAKSSLFANGNSFQAAIHQFEKQFSQPQGPVDLSSGESEPEKAKADFQAAAQAFDREHGAPETGTSLGRTIFGAKPAAYWPPGMGQSSTSGPLGNGAPGPEHVGLQNGAETAPPEAQSGGIALGSFQAQREQPSSSGSGSKSETAAAFSFSFGSTAPGKRKLPADLEPNPPPGTVEPEAAGPKTTSLSNSVEALCLATPAKKGKSQLAFRSAEDVQHAASNATEERTDLFLEPVFAAGKRENGTATTPNLKARQQPRWQSAASRVTPSIRTAAENAPASSAPAESEGSPMECSPCGSSQTPFSAFRPGLKEAPSRRGGGTRLSATPPPAGSRARRKPGREALRAQPAVPGLQEEAETDADGIAVDLANSQPFLTPSKAKAPSFEGLFAAKVGLDFAQEKCQPAENKPAARGGQPGFIFSSPGGAAATGPKAGEPAPAKPESPVKTDAGSTLPRAKAKAAKQRASPKRGKPVRQQPLRMNGQPLKAGARRAAAAQEASTAAAGEAPADQVGSKWEAFAADMRASRGSCEETAQLASEPAPEDPKTPQAAKFRAESPGPVPMSGLSYSGPDPSSPSPEDLPRPADGLFSPSSQGEAGQSQAPKAADHGPFGTTSDAASNPFRGWTSPGASCARPDPFHAPRSEASAEAFAGFSAGLLPEQRPVPVQQSVPAPGLGSRRPVGVTQQPVGMTPGRKDGKLRESKSARRKNSTASHKEVAQGGVNAQNQDPNVPSSGVDARPGAGPSAHQLEEAAAREAAQQLRAQANEMHSKGDYNKAVRLYKEAIVKLQAAGLTAETAVLFSNLAATSLQTNRLAAALHYSHRALTADASFFKAHQRAGTAHWRLGNLESAEERYRQAARHSGAPQQEIKQQLEMLTAFRQKTEQAFAAFKAGGSPEGLQKLLVENVLLLLKEAPGSQQLLSLQAHILLRLGRLSEAAQVAERHTIPAESGLPLPTWPWYVKVQAAFLQGDLEKSADLIEQELRRVEGRNDRVLTVDGGFQADVTELAAAVSGMRELVHLKEAGNKFQRERSFDTAIEKYTSALAGTRSPPPAFAAVLHANRAASHQAKGNNAEALADSLRATALDPSYAKAHSRAAALLADCGLFDAAVGALEELQRVLGPLVPASREVTQRLMFARASARRKVAVDHYKLLGLQRRCQADEVRKVYKKLALKLHPDKALAQCKFSTSVVPSAQGPATVAKLEAAVRDKANWLFQLVGDANAVLANPQSRQKYDSDLAYEERMSSGFQTSPVRGYTAQAYERHSSYSFNRPWERGQWRTESDSDNEEFYSDFSRRYKYA